jgi:uroporphyrinogen decarboxylase
MNSKERVFMAINHAEPDRVPIDFWATPPMLSRLLRELGYLPGEDMARTDAVQHAATVRQAMMQAYIRLLEGFDADFREIHPAYIGPPPQEFPDGSRTSMFGCRSITVQTQFGTYDHYISYPLDEVTTPEEVMEHSCWMDPDWFDYESLGPQCAMAKDYAVLTGSFSIWNFSFFTRGMEKILLDLALLPEVADAIIECHTRFAMQYYERTLEAGNGAIDIVRTYDDYGTQLGLMMRPATWRKLIKPRLVALVDLVHGYGAKFMLHSCGSVIDILPDIIDAGVDILDPVQTKASGMEPETLKERFGSQICFHGGLDTQDVLPRGSPEDVEEEVKHLLRVFAPGGGYLFNSSQALLLDTPLENVQAMYKAARQWGCYPIAV